MCLGEFWRQGACVRLSNALKSVNSDPAARVRAKIQSGEESEPGAGGGAQGSGR